MQMRAITLVMVLLGAVAPAAMAASSEEARGWIERMNKAVINNSYDGVLEHRWNGGREHDMVRVIHRMQDGRMAERVIFYDSNSEFVRNGSQLVWYYHGIRTIKAQTLNRSYGFISAYNGISAESDKLYDIRTGGLQRLKDYPGQVQLVTVLPRDAFRYGYRFWLDKDSAMPIRTQVIAANGTVLEEFFFVSLSQRGSIDDEMLKPSADIKGYSWRKPDTPATTVTRKFAPRENLLPTGFRMLSLPSAPDVQAGPQAGRFIVSDGIAWVSVFVSVANMPQQEGLQEAASSGTYTFVARHDGHYINVVGEVPPATVKKIAEAILPE